jgi:hypothetical protein
MGGIITICGGILAASAFIISRKPNAKELIDKLTPYEGWIGALMFFWGVWELISCVSSMSLLSEAPLNWIFWTLSGVADLLVGFILGFKLISKWVLSKNETALAKGQELRLKLSKFQVPLGFFAIAMGVLYTVWAFVL